MVSVVFPPSSLLAAVSQSMVHSLFMSPKDPSMDHELIQKENPFLKSQELIMINSIKHYLYL